MKRKDGSIASFFQKKSHQESQENPTQAQTRASEHQSSPLINNEEDEVQGQGTSNDSNPSPSTPIMSRLTSFDVISLPHDPGLRKRLLDFHPNDQDIVRREYIRRKPCQPVGHDFPYKVVGSGSWRFNPKWFESDKFKHWIEYSISKDAAFCFPCYLFKDENAFGGDAFISNGFSTWNKTGAFDKHIGNHLSAHCNVVRALADFNKQKSSLPNCFETQTIEMESAYNLRLDAHIDATRYLLQQGMPFRGHDESKSSLNRGNYLELLKMLAKRDENLAKVFLDNAPGNSKLTSSEIQKDLVSACAKVTTRKIIEKLDGDFFGILADESADVTDKEQMALCLRYVNALGEVKERFLGVVHVGDTTSLTLKAAIESLLIEHSLCIAKVRGQGYDGASNMRGSLNGLKTLILNECSFAYYVHCFAYQLQLTLVVVAKNNDDCGWLFGMLSSLLNVIGSSCKRKDLLREGQADLVLDGTELGIIKTGRGLNQEISLSRPCETRWSSHFKTILRLFSVYPTVMEVLGIIVECCKGDDKAKVQRLTDDLKLFQFVFSAQFMLTVFGITNQLNLALKRREQDIVNAMTLVEVTKAQLQKLRNHLEKVVTFCSKYDIIVPCMDDFYAIPGRSRHITRNVTNLYHYRVEVFVTLLDQILLEFGERFSEVSKELLICMSCFCPEDRFASFDTKKLVRLAEFYPNEFSETELLFFEYQLETFVCDVRVDDRFWNLKNLNELSIKLVETKKHLTHAKVYLLLKLVLILPVATATVERAFSAMTFVKSKNRSSMGDQLLNDNLVTFIERDLFANVCNKEVVNEFESMRTRRK